MDMDGDLTKKGGLTRKSYIVTQLVTKNLNKNGDLIRKKHVTSAAKKCRTGFRTGFWMIPFSGRYSRMCGPRIES
jgi:hypothetical protein